MLLRTIRYQGTTKYRVTDPCNQLSYGLYSDFYPQVTLLHLEPIAWSALVCFGHNGRQVIGKSSCLANEIC